MIDYKVFLGGRNILDVLVANEVMDEARRKKKKCLLFKIDYEKVYNSMSSGTFCYTCSQGLVLVINGLDGLDNVSCLPTSWYCNGSPLEEFGSQRGLRQRDSLPFIFTIVTKGLSGMMREAMDKKLLFMGYSISREEVKMELLQYVNDSTKKQWWKMLSSSRACWDVLNLYRNSRLTSLKVLLVVLVWRGRSDLILRED